MSWPHNFPAHGGRLDRLLSSLPIRQKLILGTVSVIGFALLLTFTAVIVNEWLMLRTQTGKNMEVQARIVASNSTAALLFDDAVMAHDTLNTLLAAPQIRHAVIFDQDGAVFASYSQEGIAPAIDHTIQDNGYQFHATHVDAFAQVMQNDKPIGQVVLTASLDDFNRLLRRNLSFTTLVFAVVFGAIILYITIVQRYVSNPLTRFTELMLRVSRGQDYSLRSEHSSEDELGALAKGFNSMLDAIQMRDKELSMHRGHLEELVATRTQELNWEIEERKQAVEELVAAKAAAETANQTKTEFLANMSHELRTPMHAILSFAAMGREKINVVPKEKLQRYFSNIHESGERLMALLNDLLDLSKLEAGRMEFDWQENDIKKVVEVVVTEFSELLRQKSLQLDVKTTVVRTTACFDKDKLLQVVRNLLSNAIKFTPEGKDITISFSEASLPKDRRQADTGTIPALRMTVSDQGVGIPEQELDEVFDKFMQSSKTKSGAGGTGLGSSDL